MICFPNAKINLGLNIVSKREDGYHNLETIFYPIPIQDALELIVKEDQKEDRFILQGIAIDGDPNDNLVMKAVRMMREHYSFPSLDVHLLKKIPFGAGIGGGSADASFMLRLINDSFDLGATKKDLATLAVKIGADCPFFIYNQPMFALGIGEELVEVDLFLKDYSFVLVKPNVHVSTKDAFSLVKPKQPKQSLKEIIKCPVSEWKNLMVNDFEESVFAKFPEVKAVKDKLYDLGAVYVSMSGSGSSVFALFNKEQLAISESDFEGMYFYQTDLL